jgi:predicted RNA binding protein YcfA (HicA-like mRNA interferase family)
MKYREVIKQIEAAGWVLETTKGGHMQYAHPTSPGKVTVPGGGKLNRDIPPKTLNSILRQAGLR